MNKSVIVYGPQGCGKTHWKERIARHLGLQFIVDEWDGQKAMSHDTLYLTANPEHAKHWRYSRGVSFAEVAQQINDAIPRTQWFTPDVLPEHHGAYETTDIENDTLVLHCHGCQWWNGSYWGGYGLTPDESARRFPKGYKSDYQVNYWRGLAEEPIVTPGAV
ncbi:hypothetical protein [Bradyrhizobium sp. BWC-3-1]|uniref:hypothetical protein n=1 Tax=Bradyrhizobium sp. BWC-3-1 TaxID=3080012 RepID=UPI00293F39EC|nr:hypothetical protein [Bradyrhizobium sp. BWC-3-1]WOH61942.1 hypothetical protein RX329_18345 [Bradyrhizobium sp. BWC-3-1]